jgi:hypothetical protein
VVVHEADHQKNAKSKKTLKKKKTGKKKKDGKKTLEKNTHKKQLSAPPVLRA